MNTHVRFCTVCTYYEEEYLGMFVLASRENTAGEKEETAIISRLTRDSTLETNIYI